MESCDCPHEANEHGTAAEFGTAMCLVTDCDCEGTREQMAALAAAKTRLSPTAERLVATIIEVLSNPMKRTTEDTARNLAAAIIGEFEIEAR